MARYVYACPDCRQEYEVEKTMARSAEAETCPHCGQTGKRVFTPPGIAIKGAPIKFSEPSPQARGGCNGACDLQD